MSEDFFDWCKIFVFFALAFVAALLFCNNIIDNGLLYPALNNVSINSTQYDCTVAVQSISFSWDFGYHPGNVLIYSLIGIIAFLMSLVGILVLFGYIPICGCGRL